MVEAGHGDLDAAWAAAEAALPEGWRFVDLVLVHGDPSDNDRCGPDDLTYGATAAKAPLSEGAGGWADLPDKIKENPRLLVSGWGQTPADALRDLAARLAAMPH